MLQVPTSYHCQYLDEVKFSRIEVVLIDGTSLQPVDALGVCVISYAKLLYQYIMLDSFWINQVFLLVRKVTAFFLLRANVLGLSFLFCRIRKAVYVRQLRDCTVPRYLLAYELNDN